MDSRNELLQINWYLRWPLTVIPCDSFNNSSKNLPPLLPFQLFFVKICTLQFNPLLSRRFCTYLKKLAGHSRDAGFLSTRMTKNPWFFWLGIPGNLNLCHWNPGRGFFPHPRYIMCSARDFFSRRDSWKQKESWMCKVSLGHSIIFANIAKKCSNETAGKEKVGYTFWQPGSLCFVLWTLWCPFGRGAPLHF